MRVIDKNNPQAPEGIPLRSFFQELTTGFGDSYAEYAQRMLALIHYLESHESPTDLWAYTQHDLVHLSYPGQKEHEVTVCYWDDGRYELKYPWPVAQSAPWSGARIVCYTADTNKIGEMILACVRGAAPFPSESLSADEALREEGQDTSKHKTILRRISAQAEETLETYYANLHFIELSPHPWSEERANALAQLMLDLLHYLEQSQTGMDFWVYAKIYNLIITNDDKAGIGVEVRPKTGYYTITYPALLPDDFGEDARVEGDTKDVVTATEMIQIAFQRLFHCRM